MRRHLLYVLLPKAPQSASADVFEETSENTLQLVQEVAGSAVAENIRGPTTSLRQSQMRRKSQPASRRVALKKKHHGKPSRNFRLLKSYLRSPEATPFSGAVLSKLGDHVHRKKLIPYDCVSRCAEATRSHMKHGTIISHIRPES